MAPPTESTWSRRAVLAAGGATLALPACGARGSKPAGATDTPTNSDSGHSGADGDSPSPRDSGTPGTDTTWASGGTAAVDPDHYPDPFATAPAPRCTLTCAAILGPCFAPVSDTGLDISEGEPGLPTLFAFRLVRADDCAPLSDLSVEVWATDRVGRYSGPTTRDGDPASPSTTDQCHGDEATARWFQRGQRRTDDDGIVRFHGVFPGWYPGRAIHLHLRVKQDEVEFLTTQFYLADELGDAVYTTHPDYSDRPGDGSTGTVRTRLADERHTLDMADYTFATQITDEGAVLASMDIALRASVDAELCRD